MTFTSRRYAIRIFVLVVWTLALVSWQIPRDPQNDGRWKRLPGPLITATEPWEEGALSEPSVSYENGVFQLWYRGGWGTCALGLATSTGGLQWTKNPANPILRDTCQPEVVKVAGTYYLYYNTLQQVGSGSLHVATSQDGVDFVPRPDAILTPGQWDLRFANTTIWVEGDMWWMLYESSTADGTWKLGLARGTSPFDWIKVAGPLNSLQHFSGMYGGPWLTKIGRTYHLWYHASTSGNLPTDIYHAVSDDLIHWDTVSDDPILPHSGWEVDQTADPNLVEAAGRTWLFYDGDDNVTARAAIGGAVASESLPDLASDRFSAIRWLVPRIPWYPMRTLNAN